MTDTRGINRASSSVREQVDAADRLARAIAGDDDERFILAFDSIMNVADGLMPGAGPGAGARGATEHARWILRGTAARHVSTGRRGLRAVSEARGMPAGSIYTDPVYIENAKSLIPNRKRVIGGTSTSAFPDCVAVGSTTGWCCTGTLVARNVVVTAGHCRGGCSSRVFVGTDVAASGEIIDVKSAVKHPKYKPPSETHDLTVLILRHDAAAEPRALVTEKMLQAAKSVRVVGFGNTDVQSTRGYGRCRMVDGDDLAARIGSDARDQPASDFQCLPDHESRVLLEAAYRIPGRSRNYDCADAV